MGFFKNMRDKLEQRRAMLHGEVARVHDFMGNLLVEQQGALSKQQKQGFQRELAQLGSQQLRVLGSVKKLGAEEREFVNGTREQIMKLTRVQGGDARELEEALDQEYAVQYV